MRQHLFNPCWSGSRTSSTLYTNLFLEVLTQNRRSLPEVEVLTISLDKTSTSGNKRSGTHFVRTTLPVWSGRRFARTVLCDIFFQADRLIHFFRKTFMGGQYLGITRELFEHYLSATFAIIGNFLGNIWATLGHYLGKPKTTQSQQLPPHYHP